MPAAGSGQGPAAHSEEAWTPFIDQARDRARATSNQMIAWFLNSNKDLARTIYRQAEIVVRQHAGDGPLDGARGRFVASLSTWRVDTASARARAEAAVDFANQLIDCYWQAYLVGYLSETSGNRPASAIRRWEPGRAAIDPIWNKIDALLLLTYGGEDDETTSQAGRTLRRALQIVADCTCPKCNK